MTRRSDDLTIEEKVVVVFDICSSTTILEDLHQTNNMKTLRNMLIAMKDFINTRSLQDRFTAYKFLGDGWILLFPPDVTGSALMNCLSRLTQFYSTLFNKKVARDLQENPKKIGLTFGVDRGQLVRMTLNGKPEYIGWPLNMACRLQGAVSTNYKRPASRVFLTNHAFNRLQVNTRIYDTKRVAVSLKNVHGGKNMQVWRVNLLDDIAQRKLVAPFASRRE